MKLKNFKISKKVLWIILGITIVLATIFLIRFIRIKTAKIEVDLVSDLTAQFASDVKVSDYILSINGKLVEDNKIDTTKLGVKKIKFYFVNEDDIKVSYEFEIEVVDETPPLVWLGNSYSVKVGTDVKLEDKIMCADNYDDNPKCEIEGDYDLNTAGAYNLVFKALDKNGNETKQNFVLNVYEPVVATKSEATGEKQEVKYTDFKEIKSLHKNEDTMVGIDVSKWQGTIDFEKLKNAGVEFVMIRVGGTRGTNKEYFVDETFEYNIKQANKYNIKAGVYFYSYANSVEAAKKDAKWVLKQIKDYDIDMPVAFDWEEWNNFNSYNLSLFGLTSLSEEFLNTIKKEGYKTLHYSSKSYLEDAWMNTSHDVWLAHYTKETNYQGDYKMWQLCDNGKVDGIDGLVDIDIYYK